MSSPCRVSLIATMDDRSVLVEDARNPGVLLRGLEGDPSELRSLIYRAWRETLRTRDVSDVDLHLGVGLPYAERSEINDSLQWLLRRVLKLTAQRRAIPRKPPVPELGHPLSHYFDLAAYGIKMGGR